MKDRNICEVHLIHFPSIFMHMINIIEQLHIIKLRLCSAQRHIINSFLEPNSRTALLFCEEEKVERYRIVLKNISRVDYDPDILNKTVHTMN